MTKNQVQGARPIRGTVDSSAIELNTQRPSGTACRMLSNSKHLILLISQLFLLCSAEAQSKVVWQIGKADRRASEFAMGPSGYQDFLKNDFGWEDRYFLVGYSKIKKDFPYVLPGPDDEWGGTGPTAGIRSQEINILFNLRKFRAESKFLLNVNLLGYSASKPPVLKLTINGRSLEYDLSGFGKGSSDDLLKSGRVGAPVHLAIPMDAGMLHDGPNNIKISSIRGSWIMFDELELNTTPAWAAGKPLLNSDFSACYVRDASSAGYEIEKDGKRFQPLLLDIQHLYGTPELQVSVDGRRCFSAHPDSARYQYEVPMPALVPGSAARRCHYQVFCEGKEIASGEADRRPQPLGSPAKYVDTRMGTAHSRWMIAPGPWMPFGMVKIAPDNQNAGWQSGYDPTIESIACFSHIHEWTMAGLGVMACNGPLKTEPGDEHSSGAGYRSKITEDSEFAPLGYYKVGLKDYGILAELTATTHCSMEKYTFPANRQSRIILDLQIPSEYRYQLQEIAISKVSASRIEGFSRQHSPDTWSGGISQDYTVYFVLEFDRPVLRFGTWLDGKISTDSALHARNAGRAGAFAEFSTPTKTRVQMRTGISLVSVHNAAENLKQEISVPFGWDFGQVRKAQEDVWNNLLGRVEITSNDRFEKVRFYTNMYRAWCSRNTWSDVNGQWMDATRRLQQLPDSNSRALGCDAFWNTFWNLNQFWNLLSPEWSSRWVGSQLAMYRANGWLAKGPAGMSYIPVMVAEHEIPLLVSTYQMGIRDHSATELLNAAAKTVSSPPERVGGGLAGNVDVDAYLKYHFVPSDKGRFSNSLEYAFDDYSVYQLALATGDSAKARSFRLRSAWWKNALDTVSGYARLRRSDGSRESPFDPFQSGRNAQYVEGNAWQLSYFVPQDVPGLISVIGKKRFLDRLEWGFAVSYPYRFNAPNDRYWDFPVMQGNEQTMHFPFLFNWAGKPWLTQKWSRAILDRYYGYGVGNAYLGDEDQGQMSAWFIMAALGLFQTDGGTRVDPIYELGSPIFEKVKIKLGSRYGRSEYFAIEARHTSRKNKYIQSALLNGKALKTFRFPASELLRGKNLILEMGTKPDKGWGIE